MRMVDPELPQSNEAEGGFIARPAPWITTWPSWFSIRTPSDRRQLRVLAQSCPVEKFRKRLVPEAIAANIA
jgi:hypothetical protein